MPELNASYSPHPPSAAQQAEIAAHRKRYEELKAAGQRNAPRVLPPPTPRDSAAIAPAAVIHREHLPGGWYWTTRLDPGDGLRIINTDGASCVSIQAWNRADPSERLNHADTVKVQWAASLRKGRVILSDMGRVLLGVSRTRAAPTTRLLADRRRQTLAAPPVAIHAKTSFSPPESSGSTCAMSIPA